MVWHNMENTNQKQASLVESKGIVEKVEVPALRFAQRLRCALCGGYLGKDFKGFPICFECLEADRLAKNELEAQIFHELQELMLVGETDELGEETEEWSHSKGFICDLLTKHYMISYDDASDFVGNWEKYPNIDDWVKFIAELVKKN